MYLVIMFIDNQSDVRRASNSSSGSQVTQLLIVDGDTMLTVTTVVYTYSLSV